MHLLLSVSLIELKTNSDYLTYNIDGTTTAIAVDNINQEKKLPKFENTRHKQDRVQLYCSHESYSGHFNRSSKRIQYTDSHNHEVQFQETRFVFAQILNDIRDNVAILSADRISTISSGNITLKVLNDTMKIS